MLSLRWPPNSPQKSGTSRSRYRPYLGLVNFYHRFVPSCAQILQPLHDLPKGAPKGNTPLTWTNTATTAFHTIKDALADATLLVHPRPNVPTCILTHASSAAVGTVLQQRIGDTWCPLTCPDKVQHIRSRVVRHLPGHFQHVIEGRDFYVCLDHKPLMFALSTCLNKHYP